MNANQFKQMVDGYLEAVDFAEKPEGQNPRFPRSTIERAQADCREFVDACGPLADKAVDLPGYSAVQFGRDFWLTRAGHGVGFWERGELNVDAGFCVTFVDRNGKTFATAPENGLGEELSRIAYGDASMIARFAYAEAYSYRGWYYFS